MQFSLFMKLPDKIKLEPELRARYQTFLQDMLDRLAIGRLMYGPPNEDRRYLSRLTRELKAYKRTGNQEHLFNVANYALLEFIWPENEKVFIDRLATSETRGMVGREDRGHD